MLTELFGALQAGKSLANVATWKRVQLWTNNLVAFFVAVIALAASFGYRIPLDEEQIKTIVSGFAVLLGLYNSYTTVATTEKIGLPSVPDSGDAGVPHGSRQESVPGEWTRCLDDDCDDEVSILKQDYKG